MRSGYTADLGIASALRGDSRGFRPWGVGDFGGRHTEERESVDPPRLSRTLERHPDRPPGPAPASGPSPCPSLQPRGHGRARCRRYRRGPDDARPAVVAAPLLPARHLRRHVRSHLQRHGDRIRFSARDLRCSVGHRTPHLDRPAHRPGVPHLCRIRGPASDRRRPHPDPGERRDARLRGRGARPVAPRDRRLEPRDPRLHPAFPRRVRPDRGASRDRHGAADAGLHHPRLLRVLRLRVRRRLAHRPPPHARRLPGFARPPLRPR